MNKQLLLSHLGVKSLNTQKNCYCQYFTGTHVSFTKKIKFVIELLESHNFFSNSRASTTFSDSTHLIHRWYFAARSHKPFCSTKKYSMTK